MSPVIDLADVHFRRGDVEILRGIDLQVRPGEHWVILGPNGAGKSSLLGICGAYAYPTTGSATILGATLGRTNVADLRRRIGHVNARYPLTSPLTVRDVVLTGLTATIEMPMRWRPDPDDLQRAERAIASVGLTPRIDARWPTLSQGERGRALVARAFVSRPPLLLLDEPCADLDVGAREGFLVALARAVHDDPGSSSLLVTHHVEEIPTIATHAMLLVSGSVAYQGPIADVVTSANLSDAFGIGLRVACDNGRWSAIANA